MDTTARLKSTPLFASLDWQTLTHLAQLVHRQQYVKGDIVCPYEAAGDTFFIVDSGEVVLRRRLPSGARRPVQYLDEGDYYGQGVLLGHLGAGLEAEATTAAEVLCLSRAEFQHFVESHASVIEQLGSPQSPHKRPPSFPWLDRNEIVLVQHRRHWFALALRLLLPVLLGLAMAAVLWLLRLLGSSEIVDRIWAIIFFVPALLALYVIVDWNNDYYAVTTERVLHREKVILTYELLHEIPLDKVQNVNLSRGIIGALLNYGTIFIQTASAGGNLTMDFVPDPRAIQAVISDLMAQIKAKVQVIEREDIRKQILLRTQGEEPRQEASPPPPVPPIPRRTGILPGVNLFQSRVRRPRETLNQVVWRKHWIFLVGRTWWLAVAAVILMGTIIQQFSESLGIAQSPVLTIAALVFLLATLLWLWWNTVDWANDQYIVTDQQIIDVEKKPLFFAEDRRQAALDMVQNISLVIPGPMAAILNYGNVVIQTAGSSGIFTFNGVPNPAAVQREVFRRVEAYKETQRERERRQRREEFANWFEIYDQVHRQPPSPEPPRL